MLDVLTFLSPYLIDFSATLVPLFAVLVVGSAFALIFYLIKRSK